MKTLRYHGIYVLRSSEESCASWKLYLIGRGLEVDGFTIK